jgi:hypothetical protein
MDTTQASEMTGQEMMTKGVRFNIESCPGSAVVTYTKLPQFFHTRVCPPTNPTSGLLAADSVVGGQEGRHALVGWATTRGTWFGNSDRCYMLDIIPELTGSAR